MRLMVATAVAIVAMAASVMFASRAQRVTAERHGLENKLILSVISDTNRAEALLGTFASSAREDVLAEHRSAVARLQDDIDRLRQIADGDAVQEQAIVEQARAGEKLDALVEEQLAKPTLKERVRGIRGIAKRHHELTERLLSAGQRLQDRQAVIERRESKRSSLLAPALIVLLGVLFGACAFIAQYRARRARCERERIQDEQERFGEALQVSDSQAEAHELLKGHLEYALGDAEITVLNRNNSADRLEPATPLPVDSPLHASLQEARPRSCMAVRLSRPYARGDGTREAVTCSVCGALSSQSTCQPLLVGGEVIGAVLTEHDGLDAAASERITQSVAQAAPVLANLRNLSIAERQAATDALTGLPNRRAVDDTLLRMLAQAGRTVTPLSVVMLDLDHFKQINDTWGHDRGDEVLAAVSARMREAVRASDFAGRNGGEEFVMFLPDTDREGAIRVAEKLRASLHEIQIPGVDRAITGSFGVASYPDDAVDAETLIRFADRALYAAKRGGRDRVESAAGAAFAT